MNLFKNLAKMLKKKTMKDNEQDSNKKDNLKRFDSQKTKDLNETPIRNTSEETSSLARDNSFNKTQGSGFDPKLSLFKPKSKFYC